MGRPSKWAGPTTAIRVPAALADQLLEIARQLEESSVQNPELAVETFSGPCLISINERSYLLQPPPMLVGKDAETLREMMLLFDGLNEKEMLLVMARLAEEWLDMLEVKRGY